MVDQLGFLRELAFKAGKVMRENRGKSYRIYQKPDRTFVTEIDLEISRMVCKAVEDRFPEYGLLTEETMGKMQAPRRRGFIFDELDGTYSYLKGRPGFTFQCAYYKQFNDLRIGLIYDPLRDLLIYGIKNAGVWIEHQQQQRCILAPRPKKWHTLKFANHRNHIGRTLGKVYNRMGVADERIIPTGPIGSKVIDFALGKVDAMVALNKGIQPWDWAPGKIILEELGYHVGHISGEALVLNPEVAKSAFGYLICPQDHMLRFRDNLQWLTDSICRKKKSMPAEPSKTTIPVISQVAV